MKDKFNILAECNFTCQYCGSKPGSDKLHVDHLIPFSKGGSDEVENLTVACQACNCKKKANIVFPPSMVLGIDHDGWKIVKRFGVWEIKISNDFVFLCGQIPNHGGGSYEYPIDIDRVFDSDWEHHISNKNWDKPHKLSDFIDAIAYCRKIIIPVDEREGRLRV